MKTKFILVGLFLLVAKIVMADKITEAQALAIAKSFASSNVTLSKSLSGSNTMTLAHASTGYYAFNQGNNNGFILVAANDLASSSVLGYADSGSFSTDDMPENLRWWLDEYDRQIEYAAANATSQSKTSVTTIAYADIEPMLTTNWGQRAPYNALCPTIGTTTCPTGCVATAMAQIMYYHKWPEQGTGSHSYTWTGSGSTQVLSVDFSESKYDWDVMTDNYDDNSTDEAKNAVAKLMYDAGVSCDMWYGTSSSAYSNKPSQSLYKYFGYDKGMNFYPRDFFLYDEWVEMLYTELAEGRPVLYRGQTSDNSGHEFVCDGYSNDYFHFNWGWYGNGNGYFRLSALNPSSSSGYNYVQTATMGIKKAEEGSSFNPYMICYSNFAVLSGTNSTYSFSDNVRFGSLFAYFGIDDAEMYLGIQVIDSNGNDTVYISSTSTTFSPPEGDDYKHNNDMSVNLSDFPAENGSYLVYPAFKEATGEWQVMRSVGTDHVVATVNDNTITFGATTGNYGVQTDAEAGEIEIYSLKGNIVAKQKASSADMNSLSSGIYFVKQNNIVKKVVK